MLPTASWPSGGRTHCRSARSVAGLQKVRESQWTILVAAFALRGARLKVTLGGNAAQIVDEESRKKVEENGKVFNLSVRLHRQTRS
jgi:hypothetical protein